jgi:hypothetical protein
MSEERGSSFSVGAVEFSVSRDGLSAKGEDLVVTVRPFNFSSTVIAAIVDDERYELAINLRIRSRLK